MFEFKVLHADESDNGVYARLGLAQTDHGQFQTPAFMPVGTRATVRGLTPEMLTRTGTQILLANTYHLTVRPSPQVVADAGGLHRFMGWDGPILTDSGGFQVFSLADSSRIDDEGVSFSSHVDGQSLRLDPQRAIEIQNQLGADIIMAFDECPPWPVDHARAADANERTIRWARTCRQVHDRNDQALFGIVQGSLYPDLRQQCIEQLTELDFAGYALGGLSVGESADQRNDVVRQFAPTLPADRPRYLMGVGRPIDILSAVEAGVDMFDCVLPTRNGRNAYAFTSTGALRLRNERYKSDFSPIDENCSCDCCRRFSRAYLRHLFVVGEMLGPILVSLHNIAFFQKFMQDIRTAICENRFADLKSDVQNAWPAQPANVTTDDDTDNRKETRCDLC